MDRRAFLAATAGLLAASILAEAQQAAKILQIGYLSYGSAAESATRIRALGLGLRDHGYVEGKNINLVYRWAETATRLPELAADLVRLKVDLLFAPTSTEVDAAQRATKTIPIVFAGHADPEGVGHVASLAPPGGNITGYRCY
jgi:putative ABC transport system substrate-binding protein